MKTPPRTVVVHIIFWPIALVSLFMNIWLFASFFSNPLYRVFGGIIGAAVDLFKLYALNRLDVALTLRRWDRKQEPKKRRGYLFPFRYLSYYILFLIVSAGASLLFGLIDIDRSIEKQNTIYINEKGIAGGSKDSLVREISDLKRDHKDLSDFSNLNRMADRIAKMTNRLLLSSGLLRIEAEKNTRRKKIEKVLRSLKEKEALLSKIKLESRGTVEVFEYLAAIIPGVELKGAKIMFLFLIILSIEVLTEECRAAMGGISRTIERSREEGNGNKAKKQTGPDTAVGRYKTEKK